MIENTSETIQQSFAEALQAQQFYLLYQPRLDLKTAQMAGVEVLVRWQHPSRGVLLASEFISLAEEKGFIVPLGEWVLKTAVAQLKTWHQAGYLVPLSVNLSDQQLLQPGLVDQIRDVFKSNGLEPRYLELDVYDTVCQPDFQTGRIVMQMLNQLGVGFAIDHFGLANLGAEQLQGLPVQRLKMDQSFMSGLPQATDMVRRVQNIIALAHELGIKSVAKGVETQEQYRLMQAYGCDELQGFYYSRPISAARLIEQFERLSSSGA